MTWECCFVKYISGISVPGADGATGPNGAAGAPGPPGGFNIIDIGLRRTPGVINANTLPETDRPSGFPGFNMRALPGTTTDSGLITSQYGFDGLSQPQLEQMKSSCSLTATTTPPPGLCRALVQFFFRRKYRSKAQSRGALGQ